MRRTVVIEYYNNGIIWSLSRGFSPQVERVFHVNCCLVLVIYFRIPRALGIRFYSQQEYNTLCVKELLDIQESRLHAWIYSMISNDFLMLLLLYYAFDFGY